MKLFLNLLLSVALFFPSLACAVEDQLVFTNVNVVDTREGTVHPNLMIVVKGGRIQNIARVGLIGRGPHLQVINAAGKYLIPGLWDMHVHSAFATAPAWTDDIILPLYIANGITGIRDMGGDVNVLENRKRRIDHNELMGPHMYIGGWFLDGSKSDAQSLAVDTPDKARAAVDDVRKRNFDFVKILSRVPRDSYYAIASESAKQKFSFVGHVPDSVTALEASMAGQKSIEHLSGIILACSSKSDELRKRKDEARAKRDAAAYAAVAKEAISTCDPSKPQAIYSAFRTNHTWQTPTLVWTHAQSNIDSSSVTSDPRLKYVPASIRAEWDPAKLLKDTTPAEMADARGEFALDQRLAGAMRKAGIMFLAGSDGPDPYVFPGFSLHDELAFLVQSGFTPLQALQAATYNAAVFMGKTDDYGTVDKDRVADMVLLDANPLDDIHNTQKIDGVVISGHYYSREDLDKLLQQVEQAASKPAAEPSAGH